MNYSEKSTALVAVALGRYLVYDRISFEQAFFLLLLAPEFYLPCGCWVASSMPAWPGSPLPTASLRFWKHLYRKPVPGRRR
ncbi:hypothetical protein P378_11715 [Desulforamulus profundi]|uniref:Uncharacterized protein n=1 Tax=Desulforamulus profundi TaxID=1383067 RepID=A0A2C6LI90_9FIRM|nr:hypothetical protein [Desulforamulus profundi]PHJ38190.1 hypothetical protein P378_11715 [Desulforamulus profundi]